MLDERERETFTNLAVFRGGFTREAAEAVAGASLRNLASLSHKSLVVANPETSRYAVHELLRQYAQDELEKDQERCDRILNTHADYYASLIEEAMKLLFSSDQPRMAAIIETDLDNIRASWRHYLATGNPNGSRNLIPGFFHLYEWRGWYQSAAALFNEPLEADIEAGRETAHLQALAQVMRAWFLALLGQAESAAAMAIEAKSVLTDLATGLENWLARQAVALAVAYKGDVEKMIAVTDEGIEITSSRDDPFLAASMKLSLIHI